MQFLSRENSFHSQKNEPTFKNHKTHKEPKHQVQEPKEKTDSWIRLTAIRIANLEYKTIIFNIVQKHSSMTLSCSCMSCFVYKKTKTKTKQNKKTKALADLYLDHFSGLCLQWVSFKDKVMSLTRRKCRLSYGLL